MYLFPATADMGILLIELLVQHRIDFEPCSNLIALSGVRDPARVIALLRQILSETERREVSVFQREGREFPQPRSLDEWWRVYQTSWFADALADERFTTWFQPIVNTSGRRAFAHECLIRLDRGRLYGGSEIVDAARIHNQVHAFDSYARRLAIRSAAREAQRGVYFVNFMPSSIYNPAHCLKTTLETLSQCGMTSANIVFEVVESELVRDPSHLRRICDYYRAEGFAFALDDVGTGANSLQMICDLQPNYIKLDKGLVRNVEKPLYAATIRKLVELAEQFNTLVIAEGVERMQTMENLWLLGVECMQGYLFGRPAPRIASHDTDLVRLARSLEPKAVPVPCHSLARV